LRAHPYNQWFEVAPGISVQYLRAGHILGSAHVMVRAEGKLLAFSGDVGRFVAPIMPPPTQLERADLLVVESTYGDRLHPEVDPAEELTRVVHDAVKRGGALIIPAFAVGRTQEILYVLRELETAGKIPVLPVYLDSPMAQKTTRLYLEHNEDMDDEMLKAMRAMEDPLATQQLHYVRDSTASKAINAVQGPAIIISASGMATGGRVLHHLRERLPDARTTVLLAGFQAEGTRGRMLKEGAKTIKMLGESVVVRATVEVISGFSAHADQGELLRWLDGGKKRAPRSIALVHGESTALQALADKLREAHFANVTIAKYQQVLDV
jgi:metallo-beta-lactamase family protein